MSAQSVEDALVAQLARSAVVQTAPEELPLFRPTSEAYFEDPDAKPEEAGGDEVLGFGVEVLAVLVTPIALRVARDVVDFLVEQVRTRTHEAGENAIDRVLARITGGGKDKTSAPVADAEPEFTPQELAQVRTLALEKARLLELPAEKAQLLADSLVGSLATA